MQMRDRIEVGAEPELVWPFVADPLLQSLWNPNIVAVDRSAEGPLEPGERFGMTYVLSGRERPVSVLVATSERPRQIVLRHHADADGVERVVEERYDLRPLGEGRTVVEQTIDLSEAGLPGWVRPVFWLITRFGRRTSPRHLATLKSAVEEHAGE